MTDAAYTQALTEAYKPVGVRALNVTLDALGTRDWASPEMQRLLRAWLGSGALDRSALVGRLDALDRAGAFPAAWAIAIRVSGLKEDQTLPEQVFYSLLRATIGPRDQARQTHWLEQAWQAMAPTSQTRLASWWVRAAVVQDRPEWLDRVQRDYPDILHTVSGPSHDPERSWWHGNLGEMHWDRARTWGMNPCHPDAQGVPFWTRLTIQPPGQSRRVVLPSVEAWARVHDPVGVEAWERDAYIETLDACMPEQVWDHLTSRSDWFSVVDRRGQPALAHALANDMHLAMPWGSRLTPWRSQLPHVRDAQWRNLIHVLLTNDHRSNTNQLRVDAFKGLVQMGVLPELTATGEGLLASRPELPDHTAMRDLIPSLSRSPQALWGGSVSRLAEVAQQLLLKPPQEGWKEVLGLVPASASPWWQGVAAVYAAAYAQTEALENAIQAGACYPDLSEAPETSVGRKALEGTLGDRLRAHMRHQALQARTVQVPHDRPRRRI